MCLNPFVKISPTSIDCITNITKTINYTYYMMGNIQNKNYRYSYDSRNRLLGESIYLGSTPIAMSTTTKTYKIYTDHLNTPRRVVDETNNIVWKWESTPFGETKPIGTLKFNLRFAGQYFDNETATHYNINRDYNPVTGRYIQSDPIGLDGGFSTFAYVNGNPVMFVDLEGLMNINFFSKARDAGMWYAADRTLTGGSGFTVAGHGYDPGVVGMSDQRGIMVEFYNSSQQFANYIKENNPEYKNFDFITMYVCSAGTSPKDSSKNNGVSFAQGLANILDMDVHAPDGLCYWVKYFGYLQMDNYTVYSPKEKGR